MKLRSLFACALFAAASGVAHAGFFDLSLNDNAFDVRGGLHFGEDENARFLLGGRYLYADEEDADVVCVIAAWAGKPSASDEVDFSLGFQGYLGEAGNSLDVEGVGIGGEVTWQPEAWKGAYVGGDVYYTPDVFSSGDTESIFEWGVRGGYQFNPKIHVFVEYISMEAEIEGIGDVDVDRGAKIGFGVRF